MSSIPEVLKYSKDHEWVRLDGDKAYVGITDHAQEELGEIVFVELPPVGERFGKDEEIATVESVKAASAIYNPIEGEVVAVNEDLDDSPDLVNTDCYKHHLYVLGSFSQSDFESLLDANAYGAFLESL
ncbi:glycine cleavage system protein GcvH [Sphaerochaeta sp. PS]|jgi:glycine cleavage system H protein|uniref:glycine cleavage system protein GcvH n=1 Tax=Sphaerochaeta sp. PS TaxID=3076336 RepID=UPI0028A55344|nr:glycine cleavage system protein GcvH [Sphaerochaeta sp. PS]MDT4761378.1 glycine cleavage system protein GcvH [Sphaerochaeta sp. PS]